MSFETNVDIQVAPKTLNQFSDRGASGTYANVSIINKTTDDVTNFTPFFQHILAMSLALEQLVINCSIRFCESTPVYNDATYRCQGYFDQFTINGVKPEQTIQVQSRFSQTKTFFDEFKQSEPSITIHPDGEKLILTFPVSNKFLSLHLDILSGAINKCVRVKEHVFVPDLESFYLLNGMISMTCTVLDKPIPKMLYCLPIQIPCALRYDIVANSYPPRTQTNKVVRSVCRVIKSIERRRVHCVKPY